MKDLQVSHSWAKKELGLVFLEAAWVCIVSWCNCARNLNVDELLSNRLTERCTTNT